MDYRRTVPLVAVGLMLLSSPALGSDAAKPASAAKAVAMDTVAKIKVGSSTKTDVAELLGTPLRSVNDEDCSPVGYQGETWEYLGQDGAGNFKINVQFDSTGIARLISRSTAKGTVVVLASAPPPTHAHEHSDGPMTRLRTAESVSAQPVPSSCKIMLVPHTRWV